MKILIDMNLSPRWVEFFNVHGIEAFHWRDCGSYNAHDSEILEYARQNGCIVFTHDLDFSAILSYSKDRKPSVIQMRAQAPIPEVSGDAILSVLRKLRQELETGALVSIDTKRCRIHLLPL